MTEKQPNDSSYKQLCWILQNDAHVDVSLVRHIFRGEPSDHCRPLCAAIRAGRLDVVTDMMSSYPEAKLCRDAMHEAVSVVCKTGSQKSFDILKALMGADMHMGVACVERALESENDALMFLVNTYMEKVSVTPVERVFEKFRLLSEGFYSSLF